MTVRTSRTRAAGPLLTRGIAELAVLVRFGDLVIALPAERVTRIVAADEVTAVKPAAFTGGAASVAIAGATLPAWDLGALLGLREPPEAWLVMRTSDDPGAPEIALGTGPCVAVAGHDAVSALPPGVINAPPAGIVGVFVTDPGLRERGAGPLGVRIDAARLIGAPALAAVARGGR
jgi:hypothetical protein